MVSWSFLILLATLIVVIEGQPSTEGFISIDCGITNGTSYTDSSTGIQYVSDDTYVDTGINYNISKNYTSPSQQSSTVRSFPNGTRNCYMLRNVTKSSKYLLRATFLYGNYDGYQSAQVNSPLQFDLNLDITFWRRVKITNASREYHYEVVTIPKNDFIWLCLVNINGGTPFISALELRPLRKGLYPDVQSSLHSNALLFRLNYGPTKDTVIRYPEDPYDRIWSWYEYDSSILTSINTKENFTRYDADYQFEAPYSVLQTALTPVSSPNLTTISYDNPSGNINFIGYQAILYLAELQNLPKNQSRQFDIYLNDKVWFSAVKPEYLKASYKYNIFPIKTYNRYVFTLVQMENSTKPPILNAMEVYWKISMVSGTSPDDVGAIMAIKSDYQIVRNWNGDPCYPTNMSWSGVGCENSAAVITSLNLSYSGLHGTISGFFAKLKNIAYLDLSHNNLSGDIPDSFTAMTSLQVLNLSGNTIGHIPDTLLKRNTSGSLLLLIDSCSSCGDVAKRKKSSSTLVIVAAVAIAIVVSTAALLLILILYKRRTRPSSDYGRQNPATLVQSEIKIFTYQQLKEITGNFSRVIGKGGFGVVYHGYIENQIEVAVKVCTPESIQGSKQFLAEVKSLSLVHHKSLVTLVGYCQEGDDLAVIYEYMPRGSLFDYLKGKDSTSGQLSWRMRLMITLEAAKALDYLHTGCGIVHRDVKSSNILLGQNFEAKVSDLGLARTFSADANASLITLCGTPGYIDPEYQGTLVLTDKSDVYSFGVILLEIVTGKPPILNTTESIDIVKLVKENWDKGTIEDVIDYRLKGEYDMNSMLKVVELAMICTNEKSTQRPTMADVAANLKVSLQMEESRENEKLQQSDKSETNTSSLSVSTGTGTPQSLTFATR